MPLTVSVIAEVPNLSRRKPTAFVHCRMVSRTRLLSLTLKARKTFGADRCLDLLVRNQLRAEPQKSQSVARHAPGSNTEIAWQLWHLTEIFSASSIRAKSLRQIAQGRHQVQLTGLTGSAIQLPRRHRPAKGTTSLLGPHSNRRGRRTRAGMFLGAAISA